jgi:hypothetical protein
MPEAKQGIIMIEDKVFSPLRRRSYPENLAVEILFTATKVQTQRQFCATNFE